MNTKYYKAVDPAATLSLEALRKASEGAFKVCDFLPLHPKVVVYLLDMLEAAKLDAARIEFVQDATVDIRCVEQGEDGYGWQVIEHHMGTPREKLIGGSFDELGLREAIDAAMAATKGEQA